MAQFVAVPGESGRVQYINVALIRVMHDHPDEDGVILEFDADHKVYLDRTKAQPLLKLGGG